MCESFRLWQADTYLAARGAVVLSALTASRQELKSLHTESVFFLDSYFKVTTKNFQFLLILAAPLDKSGSDTSAYCRKDLLLRLSPRTGGTCLVKNQKSMVTYFNLHMKSYVTY